MSLTLPNWFSERVQPVPDTDDLSVSTPELFFDLVFVFTIIQLSHVLGYDYVAGSLQVPLMFAVIWWMYAGYAWLTNAVPPVRAARRVLLLIGMSGWLIVALSVSHAFDGTGGWFALGMFVVVMVHGAMYLQSTSRFLPMFGANLTAVLLILVASFLDGDWRYLPWAAAVAVMWLSPLLTGQEGFPLHPGHITERHGLLVIIVLGESIIAIGFGAEAIELSASVVTVAVLGLMLAGCLWWAYFHADFDSAEHTLRAEADPVRRTQMVLVGFFYFHVPILLGIVAIAAALHEAIGHLGDPLADGPEYALAGGVALFLLGSVAFLRCLRLRTARLRLIAAAAVLATIPLGRVAAVLQLVTVVLLLVALLTAEEIRSGRVAVPRQLVFIRR